LSSLFSFIQPSETDGTSDSEPGSKTLAASNSTTVAIPDIGLDMVRVVNRMLDEMRGFLMPVSGQPDPVVFLISLNGAPVGLGKYIGDASHGSLGRVERKGVRLDCVIRFMLWGANADAVNEAMRILQSTLLAATQLLFNRGFLRFNALASSNPAFDSALDAWVRTADYSLLYECVYEATDAADSLIAQIPIRSDLEERNPLQRETTVITDEMVRWDNETAPSLTLRGPINVGGLSALFFISSNVPSGIVTFTRTFDDAPGLPASHLTLADFLAAVAGLNPLSRHATVTFASLSVFLAAFNDSGASLVLGDWDMNNIPDSYESRILDFASSIRLPGTADRLEVSYQDSALNQPAVLYLRALRG